MARDYKKERKYDSQPKVKAKRAARNRARYSLMSQGKVRKGDSKDVDHKDGNPHNNSPSNLRVQSASKNRSYPRTKTAGKKKTRGKSLLKK